VTTATKWGKALPQPHGREAPACRDLLLHPHDLGPCLSSFITAGTGAWEGSWRCPALSAFSGLLWPMLLPASCCPGLWAPKPQSPNRPHSQRNPYREAPCAPALSARRDYTPEHAPLRLVCYQKNSASQALLEHSPTINSLEIKNPKHITTSGDGIRACSSTEHAIDAISPCAVLQGGSTNWAPGLAGAGRGNYTLGAAKQRPQ